MNECYKLERKLMEEAGLCQKQKKSGCEVDMVSIAALILSCFSLGFVIGFFFWQMIR